MYQNNYIAAIIEAVSIDGHDKVVLDGFDTNQYVEEDAVASQGVDAPGCDGKIRCQRT